jgi:hypothetical protein
MNRQLFLLVTFLIGGSSGVFAQVTDNGSPTDVIEAFKTVCLENRGGTAANVRNTLTATLGAEKAGSLPSYSGGKPMETYVLGEVEFLVRENKKAGFGCIVAYEMPDEQSADEVTEKITQVDGLTLKKKGKGDKYRSEWTIEGAHKKDKVYLTIYADQKPRSPLIILEVSGK